MCSHFELKKVPPMKSGESANQKELNMSKARVSIYLNGCDVHWFYKANVYGPKSEEPENQETLRILR